MGHTWNTIYLVRVHWIVRINCTIWLYFAFWLNLCRQTVQSQRDTARQTKPSVDWNNNSWILLCFALQHMLGAHCTHIPIRTVCRQRETIHPSNTEIIKNALNLPTKSHQRILSIFFIYKSDIEWTLAVRFQFLPYFNGFHYLLVL